MEEIQTMNSYYHPRDYEHKDETHRHKAPTYHGRQVVYRGGDGQAPGQEVRAVYVEHAGHDSIPTQGAGEEQPGEGAPFSEKDLDVYRVLVAVERGELSAQDAARKLEELEDASPGEDNAGRI
jgi:hypothetical protein